MGLKVGIDFGTSNSGVAVYDGERIHLLAIDRQGVVPQVVKSILYITRDHKYSIGQEAVELYYRQNINRPRRYVKKWAGELEFRGAELHYVRDVYVYEDELKPGRLLQYIKTALRRGNYAGTQVFERYYSLGDLISAYLGELKQRAEALLHEPVTGAVLGRPVKFSEQPEKDLQAQETLRQAAYAVGFREVEFELEPVAAALYYETSMERPQTALIFDFGGGTLDVTIMRLGSEESRQVYASGGIGVAGEDFDRAIIENRLLAHFGKGQPGLAPEIVELIQAVSDWSALPDWSTPSILASLETAIRQGRSPARLQALKSLVFNDLAFSFYDAVEKAKIGLSSRGVTVIGLKEKDLDMWELYTRAQFEKDIRSYRDQIEDMLLDVLAASGLEPEEIDVVVKTGGSSSIPLFDEMLGALFGPQRVNTTDIFNSVSAGLAIKAYHSVRVSGGNSG
jgi:hypothetical chaperone protein